VQGKPEVIGENRRFRWSCWMDGLMEWEATEKQCPPSILEDGRELAIF